MKTEQPTKDKKGLTDQELIAKYGNLKVDLEKKLKKVIKSVKK